MRVNASKRNSLFLVIDTVFSSTEYCTTNSVQFYKLRANLLKIKETKRTFLKQLLKKKTIITINLNICY